MAVSMVWDSTPRILPLLSIIPRLLPIVLLLILIHLFQTQLDIDRGITKDWRALVTMGPRAQASGQACIDSISQSHRSACHQTFLMKLTRLTNLD